MAGENKYFSKKNVTEEEIKKLKDLMKISGEKFIILLPGRLTFWKGQKLFIEALNILNNKNLLENVYSLIIGGHQGRIKYKEELMQLVKKYNLENNFNCDGHPSRTVLTIKSDKLLNSPLITKTFIQQELLDNKIL